MKNALFLAVIELIFCASVSVALAEQKKIDDDHILFIVANNDVPENRYEGVVVFLPVNKVDLFETSQNYAGSREKIKKVVILYETVKKLTSEEELILKDFLLKRFAAGKEIWVVGNTIPDNFLQLWLEIKRKARTHHISYADFQLASGLWKDDEGIINGSNIRSPQLLSLNEILKEIREINK